MLTIMRSIKIMVVIMWVCGLLISACEGETVTSYSGGYAADLEQKQMFLESIKEDADTTENALRHESEKVRASAPQDISRLKMENIDLAEIVPSPEKIHIALISMSGTLSPRSGENRLSQNKDKSCE